MSCWRHQQVDKFNDFAHIPWEGTPDFPKQTQRKEIPKQKLLVKGRFGIFQGYVGEILDK